uniref:Diphthamide biosynthesis protein 3 n=1 Tax=viral metagenome TaxID=1070528 RepID=A0A6C0E5V0_9ZZZZ
MNTIINHAFDCVMKITKEHEIDESHALKHSIEVFNLSREILQSELTNNTQLTSQQNIIYCAAILHDMCDKKYMNDEEGLKRIQDYMKDVLSENEIEIMSKIIMTMSYSKVCKNGYPDMGEYQLAYHIVREADLLAAYDIDRCVIFGMYIDKLNYTDAVKRAIDLFSARVLTYISDNLFITEYSKTKSKLLHIEAAINLEKLTTRSLSPTSHTRRANSKSKYYEEVEIEDLDFDEKKQIYTYPCPCGDKFSICLDDLHDGEDVATCPSCTLRIKVIYDEDKLPEFKEDEE